MRNPTEADSAANTCDIEVGRLLEIVLRRGFRTTADVDAMMAMINVRFERVTEPARLIIAADWRACNVLPPAVASRVVEMLTRSNPRVERGAILHDPSHSTSVFQAFRLSREADFAERRIFTDAHEMEVWLSEVLTPIETARVRAMLHQRPQRARP